MGCCLDKTVETNDEYFIFKQIEFKIRVDENSNKDSSIKHLKTESELLQELLYVRSLIRNRNFPIIINIKPYIILKNSFSKYKRNIVCLYDIKWSEGSLVIQHEDYELVIACFYDLDEALKENIKAFICDLYTI